ncbi:MAG: translation initiation factor IF-1 [Acidobacteriaceae bacterium]|nr:translation initiation factor IF-1 [Acidobacteriaceae bacterium]MBV9223389.1 translation initiation factor IF-1 [Acidobacteriaceae bacterium]MBV9306427.1 translation initiation factor IF-1 [Acidobacteriaceae bacterium]
MEAEGTEDGERIADGIVAELLPSALVRVRLEGEHQLIAHLPSAQRANFVRLRVGDRVRVALSVQDRTRGRVLELLTKGRMP